MIIRYLLVRRLHTVRLQDNFNFNKSFDHLTKSPKYETFRTTVDQKNLIKYEQELSSCFKRFQFQSLNKYNHLELKSKILLCDSINSKYHDESAEERKLVFRKFFDQFFRSNFKYLLEQKYMIRPNYKESFLFSIDPELHLKILLYYANFYLNQDLHYFEIKFLEDYLAQSTSFDYEYDLYEFSTLLHSVFKLNLRLNEETLARFVDRFLKSSYEDQQVQFYNFVKLMRQQKYFDARLMEQIKKILIENAEHLQSKVLINILTSFSSLAYYDEEVMKRIEQVITTRNDLRFKDAAKYLWACASVSYDFNSNPTLLEFIIDKVKRIKNNIKPFEAVDAIKSLIMCDIYDFDIINTFLNDPEFKRELESSNRAKLASDLYFITKSVEIERPEQTLHYSLRHISIPISKDIVIELKLRKSYDHFIKFLEFNLDRKFTYEFVYPLSHINISSIFVTYFNRGVKKTILIDIIDETNTLQNRSDKPKGLFKTKLRQMKAKGFKFVLYKRLDDNKFVKIG